MSYCGKTSCPMPKPHEAHRCDHGIMGPCLACEDWPWQRFEQTRAAFETGARRGERSRAWIIATAAGLLRRFTKNEAADRLAEARRLLERVAAVHPGACDDPTCPFPDIRRWLGAS